MAFQLKLSNPCSEKWEQMSEMTDNERFCLHCQKNVIDFTEMTDTEIILFFQNYKEEKQVCGRITQRQLAETYPQPALKPNFRWLNPNFQKS